MSHTPTAWPEGRLLAIVFETTGIDPATARIVAAAVVAVGGNEPVVTGTWIVDPGVDIPVEAAAIHGITTDRACAEGRPPAAVLPELVAALNDHAGAGLPVVAFRAPYGLTVLDRECTRHEVALPEAFSGDATGRQLAPVIDPYVIDKQMDRFRRGKRTLPALCQHYRVRHDGPPQAANDALAAARLAWRLPRVFPDLARMELPALHRRQIEWAAEQADGLQQYKRRTDPTAVVDGHWPLIPAQRA